MSRDRRIRGNRFGGEMSDGLTAACLTCIRKSPYGPSCEAFPGGIPMEILDGRNDHRAPFPGDHGMLYVPEGGA